MEKLIMDDTRINREKRDELILKCLRELVLLEAGEGITFKYNIETWTKDDSEPIVVGEDGIQITVSWQG